MDTHVHGYNITYDSKRRFASYWHQIREIISLHPESVLEVGMGSGFLSHYLKEKGVTFTTVDHNARLHPDVIADVTKLPFSEAKFDVVAAFEVLEHMPYEESLRGLSELARISKIYIVLSLPDATHAFRFAVTIPRIKYVEKIVSIPHLFPKSRPYAKSHDWEIGIRNYPLSRILKDAKKIGLNLVRTYRVYGNPYHRFFIFRKD